MPTTRTPIVAAGGLQLPISPSAGALLTSDSTGNASWSATAVTFLAGTGAPAGGADGAIYLNLTTLELFGPRASGAWPSTAFARLMPLAPTWANVKAG